MSSRNSFLSILSCALIALCFFSSGCSSKQSGVITKQQVSTFLEEMDKAAQNKDIDHIVAGMSEDVQFKMTVVGFGPTQTLTFTRDQYRDYGRSAFAVIEAYDYRRGETVIKVDLDGQSALVADEVFETTTVGGKVIRSVARTTSTLKVENGKLVISRSEATVRPIAPGKGITPVKL